MPSGDNPNSRKNLIKPTSEMARINGSKGGKAKAKAKRELAKFIEIDAEVTTYEERKKMLEALKTKAMHGNIQAMKLYAEMMAQMPDQRIMVEQEIHNSNPYDGLTVEELRKLASQCE